MSGYFGSLGIQLGLLSFFGGLFLGGFFNFLFFQPGSFLFNMFKLGMCGLPSAP